MSQKAPVVLTYFAQNPDQKHLAFLEDEYEAIEEAWRRAAKDKTNDINVQYMPNSGKKAELKRITDDIAISGELIILFHFSGHAGNQQIFLNDVAGNVGGLAALLALHARKNLRLVFLNGCSTKDQVEILLENQVPVVIATQCRVGDKIAGEFAKEFYGQLTKYPCSIQKAYDHALAVVKADGDITSLPATASKTAEPYAYEASRGLDTDVPETDIWKLYVRKGAERFVTDPDWWQLPDETKRTGGTISLERAYTCNRQVNTTVFRQFFDPYGRTTAIQHYLIADANNLSPLGLSSKLVYEHITRDMPRNRNFCHFPDPNESTFTDDFVVLDGPLPMTYEHIAGRIYDRLVNKFPNGPQPAAWSEFKDFYTLVVAQNREYLIVFLKLDEQQLPGLIAGISTFITSSTAYAATNPNSRPKLLFFWHLLIKEPERSGLKKLLPTWLTGDTTAKQRQACFQKFNDLCKPGDPATSQVWVLHENTKSLSRPDEDDIENWLQDSLISSHNRLEELVDVAGDVRNLELEFRTLIEQKRAQEAASRLATN